MDNMGKNYNMGRIELYELKSENLMKKVAIAHFLSKICPRKKLKTVSELMTSCLSPETSFPSLKVMPQKRPQKLTKHKGEKKWRTECHLSILHSKCEKAKVRVKKLVGLCFLSPLAGSRNNCVNFER